MSDAFTTETLDEELVAGNIHFVPIRHHSPTCSFALLKMIEAVKPCLILVEGPSDADPLLQYIPKKEVVPPVAFFYHTVNENKKEMGTLSFFPFCEYSPEWNAIKKASELKIPVHFIDLPGANRPAPETETEVNLQDESSLSTTAYINSVVKETGCRDFNEAWDLLFESRSLESLNDYQSYFREIYSYCKLSRESADGHSAELQSDKIRENYMAAKIIEHAKTNQGQILIVTGGFHTSALSKMIKKTDGTTTEYPQETTSLSQGPWLIPYSYEKLDALNGYGAGMPSPGFHRLVWEKMRCGEIEYLSSTVRILLSEYVAAERKSDLGHFLSTADLFNAAYQAQSLAALRNKIGPGRNEFLDACLSCFVKKSTDEISLGEIKDLKRFLCGKAAGDVGLPGLVPPILEDARRIMKFLKISRENTEPKRASLDLYRKSNHRIRSRFFHLFSFLETSLVRFLKGPDFISLNSTGLLFEEWEYSWSPVVDAMIIGQAVLGDTLATAAGTKIIRAYDQMKEDGKITFDIVISFITKCLLMGLHTTSDFLAEQATLMLKMDQAPPSLIRGTAHVCALAARYEVFDIEENYFSDLIGKGWEACLLSLIGLDQLSEEAASDLAESLALLFDISRQDSIKKQFPDAHLWHMVLEELCTQTANPGLQGAAEAIAYLEGIRSAEEFCLFLKTNFGTGAHPESAVKTFKGIVRVMPEALLKTPFFLDSFVGIIDDWDEETFMRFLPDLREDFEKFKPSLLDDLAQKINGISGNSNTNLRTLSLDPETMQSAHKLYTEWLSLSKEAGFDFNKKSPEQNNDRP